MSLAHPRSVLSQRFIEEACIFPASNIWGGFVMYTLGPIGLSVLILGYGFVLQPLMVAMKGGDKKRTFAKRVSKAWQDVETTRRAGRPSRRASTKEEKDSDKTKEAAMSAFLALTYFVFPGASLQILKGLARDERFDNDPEYFEDWQTGEGAPKNMCRLHYDCE